MDADKVRSQAFPTPCYDSRPARLALAVLQSIARRIILGCAIKTNRLTARSSPSAGTHGSRALSRGRHGAREEGGGVPSRAGAPCALSLQPATMISPLLPSLPEKIVIHAPCLTPPLPTSPSPCPSQSRMRAEIRLREGRPKAIDLLARNIACTSHKAFDFRVRHGCGRLRWLLGGVRIAESSRRMITLRCLRIPRGHLAH